MFQIWVNGIRRDPPGANFGQCIGAIRATWKARSNPSIPPAFNLYLQPDQWLRAPSTLLRRLR